MKQVIGFGKIVDGKVKVYDRCKYNPLSEKIGEYNLTDIDRIEIVSGEDAADIEITRAWYDRDDNSEYLVVVFDDESTWVFRNSRVDFFKVEKAA